MTRKSKAAEFVQEELPITVTGLNVEITDPMKAYALEKIGKIEKFSLRIVDVIVKMDIQKLDHRVDIILKVDHIFVKAHAVTENMYASIDLAVDRLQRQLSRYHKRIRDHHARGVSSMEMNVNVLRPREEDLLEVNGDIDDENRRQLIDNYRLHSIVRREKMPLRMLRTDEAMLKMQLSGDAFLLFRSEEDMKLKVIYRRNDGDFGLIEPQL